MSRFLKKLLPKKTRRSIYKLGQRLYLEDIFPGIESTLASLKKRGFSPEFVIDVGAYHGEWANMFRHYFPDSSVLMIEAQEEKQDRLNKLSRESGGHIKYEQALLGAEDGKTVTFHKMETGSSVFEESSPYHRETITARLSTLDTVLKRHPGFQKVEVLKLDVQGYELEVLKGASELLQHVELVLMESSLVQVNQGCPLFSEVVEYMSNSGFRLLDFCSQIRRKDGTLWQTDLLFINNSSSLIPKACLDEENWRKLKPH